MKYHLSIVMPIYTCMMFQKVKGYFQIIQNAKTSLCRLFRNVVKVKWEEVNNNIIASQTTLKQLNQQ